MTIRIANAPASWAIYEFTGITPKYTYQQVMDQIAETGYTGTELGPYGFFPTDPAVLQSELDKRNLRLLSAFVPVNFADGRAIEQAETDAMRVGRLLKACNAIALVLADDSGKVPELVQQAGKRSGSWLKPEEWDVYAAGLNRVARKIHDELGLKVVFHHHCAGFVETPEEVRSLLGRADYDLVGLCLDTGHWELAGGKTLDCIAEYGERVRYLHFKDCDPAVHRLSIDKNLNYFDTIRAGIYCELGRGSVDFPGLVREMEKLGYDGWAIVEQDVLTEDLDAPRQSARQSRAYLRSIGL